MPPDDGSLRSLADDRLEPGADRATIESTGDGAAPAVAAPATDEPSASDPMPWGTIAVLSVSLVAAGILQVVIARRGARGGLDRNRMAGIRTSATLASDEAWDAGHRAGAALLQAGGAAMVATGLAILVRPSNLVGVVVVLGGVGVTLALVLLATRRANRAARAAGPETRPDG